TLCWSTEELEVAGDSLIYGPHYHQEKWYRRWLYDDPNMSDKYDVRFIARYNMALVVNDPSLQLNEEICRITVTVRHAPVINGHWDGVTVVDDTLKETKTLYASDFQPYGQFKSIYFSDTLSQRWYKYPPEFQSPLDDKMNYPAPPCTVWVDNNGNNGVEFRVEWLGNTKCDLYIDNIEVYDDFGWKDYIEEPFITTQNIIKYAQDYADSFSTWNINLANWMGCDEPSSIDSYTPLRIVDSILASIDAPRLMVHFYPQWYITVNADSQLARYYRMAKPDILNIHFFPFNSWSPTPTFFEWDVFRQQLEISASLTGDKGFWYKAQNFGYEIPGGWLTYRRPTPEEHKAEIMLALAHGVKGLIFSHFESYPGDGYTLRGFIGMPHGYEKDTLYGLVKYNLIPRLKGKLGKTLMGLDYTGDYLQYYYFTPTENTPSPPTFEYFTIGSGSPSTTMNWHCSFFESEYFTDDKYFMLANLLTTADRSVDVTIEPVEQDYTNYRFRNIEGGVDTSFTSQLNYLLTHSKGEGYLYEVAPVIKYGGKLIANDTVDTNISLIENMTVNNSKSIEIKSGYKYTVNDTVTLLGTGFITGDGYLEREGNGWIVINQ
ncbi:MAG: hypothetical protein WBN42_08910, partial [Ignavibacteriaceae bacterium]